MTMELPLEDEVVSESAGAERPVDCERLRLMGLAELLYHALVEWGGEWEGAAA